MSKFDLSPETKIQILLQALEERYRVLHTIRERMQNVSLWSLGILLGAGGWLIQSKNILTCEQKILFSFFVLIAFAVVRFAYLSDLAKGFRSQQQVVARIEDILGLFDKNFSGSSEESVYPERWKNSGLKGGDGKFIQTNYALLYIGVVLILIVILLNGSF